MSKPVYFQNFPNVDYALEMNKAGVSKYIKIKDYFNLLTVREEIFREDTLYVSYQVKNGERPEQVSWNMYQDEQFYWVVLQINEITDYYSQWPLSEKELSEHVYKKYGGVAGAESVHHYETVETFDSSTPPNLMLPGGLTVPSNYIFRYPITPGATVILSSTPVAVTNYEYERRLNEEKAQILVLAPKYIYDYDREVRNYAKNLKPSVSFLDFSDITYES